MSAVIASSNEVQEQTLPWYRYGWPWFLISIPFISICLGSVMLYLAFSANNSLVVDDYYKEGKAYNLRIERDRLASLLGLDATVTQSSEGIIVQLVQSAPADLPAGLSADSQSAESVFAMPEALRLRWVHVTQSERDGEARLQSIGAGRYIAQQRRFPQQGKYRLHMEPASSAVSASVQDQTLPNEWRLISKLTGLSSGLPVSVLAPAPDSVYPASMLK